MRGVGLVHLAYLLQALDATLLLRTARGHQHPAGARAAMCCRRVAPSRGGEVVVTEIIEAILNGDFEERMLGSYDL